MNQPHTSKQIIIMYYSSSFVIHEMFTSFMMVLHIVDGSFPLIWNGSLYNLSSVLVLSGWKSWSN
jgi:hypothetical protein